MKCGATFLALSLFACQEECEPQPTLVEGDRLRFTLLERTAVWHMCPPDMSCQTQAPCAPVEPGFSYEVVVDHVELLDAPECWHTTLEHASAPVVAELVPVCFIQNNLGLRCEGVPQAEGCAPRLNIETDARFEDGARSVEAEWRIVLVPQCSESCSETYRARIERL